MKKDLKKFILKDEEIFNLECDDLYIIQNKKGYTFTTDAVILANIAKANNKETVVDLGTGSGVIPLLMFAKTKAKKIYGIEIQPRLYDMAKRSVIYNGLKDNIEILNLDIRVAHKYLAHESIDVVVSNPPYMPVNKNETTKKIRKNIEEQVDLKKYLEPIELEKLFEENEMLSESMNCKTEMLITLDEIVHEASKLLKYGGRFYCIVKSERLTDLMVSMRKYLLEPKKILPIQPSINKAVDTVVVEGRKNGKSGIRILKPLIITEGDGFYTKEVYRMYYSHFDKGV